MAPRLITKPKPFTRDICGSGNRVTLGKVDPLLGACRLSAKQAAEWDSPLTCELFRRAVRSILKERAQALAKSTDSAPKPEFLYLIDNSQALARPRVP